MSPISVTGVGDIIALAHIAWEIVSIIYGASTTSKDLLSLAGDIAAVPAALDSAQKILSSRADIPSHAATTVTHAFQTCEEILQDLHRYIGSYRERQVAKHPQTVWATSTAAFCWSALGGKRQVEGLRSRLGEQLALIHIFLTEFQTDTLMQISARIQEQHSIMERLAELLTSMPPTLRHNLPFVLFEKGDQNTLPVAKLPYLKFLDILQLVTYRKPVMQAFGERKRRFQTLLDAEIPCRCYFYFEVYVYQDPANLGEPSVLVSQLHHGVRQDAPRGHDEEKCFWGINICGMSSQQGGKEHSEGLNSDAVDANIVRTCLTETLWESVSASLPSTHLCISQSRAEPWKVLILPLLSSLSSVG